MFHGGLLALAALVLGRSTVSFQFQSVTPLADGFGFAVTPSALGIMLGVYMAPGAVAAVASPILLQRLGWRVALQLGFAVMVVGQIALLLANSLHAAFAARLLAGVGGCVVYVLTVGFVAQLGDGGPLPRRMGAIASSWPIGNALALVVLGPLHMMPGVAGWIPLALVVVAAAAIATTCRAEGSGVPQQHSIALGVWWTALRRGFGIGICFALYNVAFILLTSFSPTFLVAQGYQAPVAASIASIPMWMFILSVPFGGVLAGWLPGRDRLLVTCGCLGSAAFLLLALASPHKVIWYVLAGLIGGLPTAPMWAGAGARGVGSGAQHLAYPALFLVFFLTLLICPPIVGTIVEKTHDPRLGLVACSALLALSAALFLLNARDAENK